jgi:tungstate transport system permease protein
MEDFQAAFSLAAGLIFSGDADLLEIIVISLSVSVTAVGFACAIGMVFGSAIAVTRFPGRQAIVVLLNALMGLPPVVVGLGVYLLLSRAGPLGVLGLLYTPTAMIIAQTILVMPVVAALTRQVIEDLHREYDEPLKSLGVKGIGLLRTLLWDARYSLITVGLAGFGRAVAEVGAVIIVGGNIDHLTRMMTTAITLETSKGNLALALGLGIVLIGISLAVNAAVAGLGEAAGRTRNV